MLLQPVRGFVESSQEKLGSLQQVSCVFLLVKPWSLSKLLQRGIGWYDVVRRMLKKLLIRLMDCVLQNIAVHVINN